MVLFISDVDFNVFLFYPASLVLTILRFKDRIDQEKGYKIRSKIAFIWNMAWLVLYSMAFLEWFVDSKWEREYQKYLNEKIIHPQKKC